MDFKTSACSEESNKIKDNNISDISNTIKEYLDTIKGKKDLYYLEKSAIFIAANIARKCMDKIKYKNHADFEEELKIFQNTISLYYDKLSDDFSIIRQSNDDFSIIRQLHDDLDNRRGGIPIHIIQQCLKLCEGKHKSYKPFYLDTFPKLFNDGQIYVEYKKHVKIIQIITNEGLKKCKVLTATYDQLKKNKNNILHIHTTKDHNLCFTYSLRVAKKNLYKGGPIAFEAVTNLEKLAPSLSKYKKMGIKFNNIVINGHGSRYSIQLENRWQHKLNSKNILNLKNDLLNILNEDGTIYLNSCNSGYINILEPSKSSSLAYVMCNQFKEKKITIVANHLTSYGGLSYTIEFKDKKINYHNPTGYNESNKFTINDKGNINCEMGERLKKDHPNIVAAINKSKFKRHWNKYLGSNNIFVIAKCFSKLLPVLSKKGTKPCKELVEYFLSFFYTYLFKPKFLYNKGYRIYLKKKINALYKYLKKVGGNITTCTFTLNQINHPKYKKRLPAFHPAAIIQRILFYWWK